MPTNWPVTRQGKGTVTGVGFSRNSGDGFSLAALATGWLFTVAEYKAKVTSEILIAIYFRVPYSIDTPARGQFILQLGAQRPDFRK
jgi:hypothetical protein